MIIKIYDGYKSAYTGQKVDDAVSRAYNAAALDENNVFTGSNEFTGSVALGSQATVKTPSLGDNSEKVANTEFVKSQGYLTEITSEMIANALGYTPYDGDTNPNGYITGITYDMVTGALGYTPENPANRVTTISSTSTDLEYPSAKAVYNAIPTSTTQLTNDSGYITGINYTMVVNALTYTPYDSSNPSGYQANIIETVAVNGTALTPTNKTVDVTVPTSTTQLTNDSDFITSSAIADMQTKSNLVTSMSSLSTDSTYPSAKAVYSVTSSNTTAISTINSKIPLAASSENQLADKNFVNSSVATNTAYFIGTFNSVAELEAYSGTLTNNDYAFVATTDTAGNTLYDRYKYNASTQEWTFEYELNNSSFTSDQWAAINSGANSTNVSQIATNTSLIGDLQTQKQDVIEDLETIRAGATAGATAIQPNDNITKLTNNAGYISGITASMVVDALTYTPYDSSNPSGYQANIIETIAVNGTTLTPTDKTVNIPVPTSTTQLTNDSDFITSSAIADMQTKSNLVTSISSASTDTTYPSAKLLYDELLTKQDTSNSVTHPSGSAVGGATQPVYISSSGVATTIGYTVETSVPSGALFTDTKNTAGATDSNEKLYLIGAVTQSENPQTYSHDTVYVNADGVLNSANPTVTANGTEVATTKWVSDKGYLTTVTSTDVTNALGYTPYNASNPNGYISTASINSLSDTSISGLSNGQALLYNATTEKWTNSNIVTSISWGDITGTLSNQTDLQTILDEKTTMAAVEQKGYLTTVTSTDVVSALGYTPYDASNPNGYIVGISSADVVSALGYTPYDSSNPDGFIDGSAIADMQTTSNLVTTVGTASTDSTYPSAKAVFEAIQQGGGPVSLDDLSDVDISSPAQGQNLTYDETLGKWKNTSTSATVAWGGITGLLSDQTDLDNALKEKTTKFSTINPALTSSGGKCTWSITNEIGSKKVQVSIYDASTYAEVVADVSSTDANISVEFLSNSNIGANTYEAIIIG